MSEYHRLCNLFCDLQTSGQHPIFISLPSESTSGSQRSIYDAGSEEAFFESMGCGKPGHIPMPKILSPQQVRQIIRNDVPKIFNQYASLRGIWSRHGDTIQKRWTKKTKEQKKKYLVQCWPSMAISHRPDFKAFQQESEIHRASGTAFRDAFLMPYMNQEDLAKPRTLLLFLSSRATSPPAEFAFHDFDASHLGRVTAAVLPIFLNLHSMMFSGRNTAETYGELLAWADNPGVSRMQFDGRCMSPGEGLLVLEAQRKLFDFSVQICHLILQDIDPGDLIGPQYPLLPELPSVPEPSADCPSLVVMAAEAPYRRPSQLDLGRIVDVLEAKISDAWDHAWLMREDPSYFTHHVLQAKNHRLELVLDTKGKKHPLVVNQSNNLFWIRIIGDTINNVILPLELWTELRDQATQLRDLHAKFKSRISQTKPLPKPFLHALLKFQLYLHSLAKGLKDCLGRCVPASPPLRHYFERLPEIDLRPSRIRVQSKSMAGFDQSAQSLLWLLEILWEDDHELFLVGMTNAVDELGRLLESEPTVKSIVSSDVASCIADLGIICECLRQIETYYPWANGFEYAKVKMNEEMASEYNQKVFSWDTMIYATLTNAMPTITRLGNPSDGKFRYPAEKRRSRDTVEAMYSAESHLDLFWKLVDSEIRKTRVKLEGTALYSLLQQLANLQRTPPWLESIPDTTTGKPNADSNTTESLAQSLSDVYYELQRRTEQTLDNDNKSALARRSKNKIKTTGVPNPVSSSNKEAPTAALLISATDSKVEVDSRALKVFRSLFFTPSASFTPGEIAWVDFLHAMKRIGFQMRQLYGSVWHFIPPPTWEAKGSIHFHEPHPSTKLAFHDARYFGRRLSKKYGWYGGMFTLAEKQASQL